MSNDIELPDPVLKNENTFRHYSDDFSVYVLGKHNIPIPKLSYVQTKEIRKIGTEHDKKVLQTIESMKTGSVNSSDTILDSEDRFIDQMATAVFPKLKSEIMNDPDISRGTLFATCKELFIFLVASPATAELLQSRAQSN